MRYFLISSVFITGRCSPEEPGVRCELRQQKPCWSAERGFYNAVRSTARWRQTPQVRSSSLNGTTTHRLCQELCPAFADIKPFSTGTHLWVVFHDRPGSRLYFFWSRLWTRRWNHYQKSLTKWLMVRQLEQRSWHPSVLGLRAPVGRALKKKNAVMTSPLLVSYQTFPKTKGVSQFTNGKKEKNLFGVK